MPLVGVQLVLVLVLLFFLLASGDMSLREDRARDTAVPRQAARAVRIAHDIERQLSRYLLTITLVNAGTGAAVGLAMWALGMPRSAAVSACWRGC